MPTLTESAQVLSAFAAMAAALLAAGTLVKVVVEYVHQNTIKRFEKLHDMSKRFDDNRTVQDLCQMIREDAERLDIVSKHEKEVLICLIEEVAYMKNSGIIRGNLSYYSFGYIALQCYRSKRFWRNINRDDLYYTVFRNFCLECERFERRYGPALMRRSLYAMHV